jgi:hypothetical protein
MPYERLGANKKQFAGEENKPAAVTYQQRGAPLKKGESKLNVWCCHAAFAGSSSIIRGINFGEWAKASNGIATGKIQ